ncbi:MAG TPA: VRR-NUC domain-containing protein [Marinobacterium sp.]|nr:VRR-NUC domain-containing protein [Marinobacterium sp.]
MSITSDTPTAPTSPNGAPVAASLDNPLYYLENARTLIAWVRRLHADLLECQELEALENLLAAEADVQALLIRMIMRTQTIYRRDQLEHYAEISGDTQTLLNHLADIGLVRLEPAIEASLLPDLLNREALLRVYNLQANEPLPKSAAKGRIKASLAELNLESRSLSKWVGEPVPSVALECQALFDRLRLMFFGNLRQSWSDFVVTELGYFNYEPVELNEESRAFHDRREVDQFLQLDHIYQQQEQLTLNERVELATAIDPINDWIGGRYARLLLSLGQEAERSGETDQALLLYRQSGLGDALIRELRVMERNRSPEAVQDRIAQAQPRSLTPQHQLSIARVAARIGKKLGVTKSTPKLRTPEEFKMVIPRSEQCVELATAEALAGPEAPVAYVENCLINSLFGLHFWEVLYAPVPGAFFHPFQSQPADLFRSAFRQKRQQKIAECWAALEDGRYVEAIMARYEQKRGITNAFIHWSIITPELLSLALKLIPAQHLRLIFERLLSDIRTHRSGFPDLIQFDLQQQSYRLIEVKGPGDRLQDNQKLWLDYFVEHQIPCSVCWISWAEGDQTPA